tara:strand:+ start:86 stop:955 length:870 start_codon:yes stop_codon:yes gene_type:complete
MNTSQKTKLCDEAARKSGLELSRIEELLFIAKQASEKGGLILMESYGKINEIKSKGRVGDLVTNADLQAEKEIIEFLSKETPQIEILAEESGESGSRASLRWCIDPLDGTTNFAHGYPFFATSIGLCWNDLPLLGSISIPFIKEVYYAAPRLGAFCNQEKINVSKSNRLIDSLLVTGFAYDRFTELDNNYSEFCWLTHRTRGVRRGGAAAVDLAFVAAGRIDGYWERGLARWDMAAGIPIVEEAGGLVSNYPSGNFNISSGKVLATTPGIELELKEELAKVNPLPQNFY